MKKRLWSAFALLIAMFCALCLAACSDNGEEGGETSSEVASIQMSEAYSMQRFQQATLTAVALDADGEVLENKTISWSSSDTSILTVEDGGAMTAVAEGTANVTATCEDVSAVCVVTVSAATVLPQLTAGDLTSYTLSQGATYTLTPYVTYDGTRQSDVVFSYASDNEEVASVSEDGTITATGFGTATITVTGSWRGAGADILSDTVSVTVLDGYAGSVSAPGTTIYTANLDLEEEGYGSFSNTVTLTAFITNNGTAVTPAQGSVVWSTDDTGIVSVDSTTGVVTAKAEGEAIVSFTYTKPDDGDNDGTPVTADITITVSFPTVDMSADESLDLDLSAASEGSLTVSAADIFPTEGVTIASVYDVTHGASVTYENGGIATASLSTGEQVWTFRGDTYAVTRGVVVATKVIYDAEDLFGDGSGLQAYADVTEQTFNNTTFYAYSGYYVLADDIDVSESSYASTAYAIPVNMYWSDATTAMNSGYGFTGTFDGRGHTINGIILGRGGLFGMLAYGSRVENVAITNVTLSSTQTNQSVLAAIMGGATISNVYIDIVSATNTNASVVDQFCAGNTLENVVIVANIQNETGGAFTRWAISTAMTASNVYVYALGDCENFILEFSKTAYNESNFAELGLTGVTFAADYPESQVSSSGFDTTLWNTQGNVPVFASAVDYLIEAIDTTAQTISAKEPYTAPEGYIISSISAGDNTSYLTIGDDNTTLTLSSEAPAFSFTVTLTSKFSSAVFATVNFSAVSEIVTGEEIDTQIDYGVKTDTASAGLTLENEAFTGTPTVSYLATYTVYGTDGSTSGTFDVSDVTVSDGSSITIAADALAALAVGDYQFTVALASGAEYVYTNVTIATRAIGTWEEFNLMRTDAVLQGETNYYKLEGYYVLTGNILPADEEDYLLLEDGDNGHFNSFVSGQTQYTQISENGYGFTGVFDGRGYTVDSVHFANVRRNTIFGDIAGGTIKNVAFTNMSAEQAKAGAAYFALTFISVGGHFENVVLHYNYGSNNPAGGIAYAMDGTNTFTNVVIYGNNTSTADNAGLLSGQAGRIDNVSTDPAIRNVFCVYPTGSINAVVGAGNVVVDDVVTAEYNGTAYVDAEPDWSGLPASVFDTETTFIPVLAGTAELIQAGTITLDDFID